MTTAAGMLDVAVVSWSLLHGGGPVTLARAARVAAGAILLVAAQGAAVLVTVGSAFLAISVAWVFAAVAWPACGLIVLLAARRRAIARSVRALAWIAIATIPIWIHASFVEPFRLVTERCDVVIPGLAARRPILVGVLADIQCVAVTEREHEAVRRVMEAAPDIVLLPGDFVQVGSHDVPRIAPDFRTLLAPLEAPLGVWCVQGDTDTRSDVRALIAGTRVRFLDDEVVEIGTGADAVLLAGISIRYDSPSARAALQDLGSRQGDALRLVVAHRPDVVYELSGVRADLVVAGHTHGGQIVLPFLGPPFDSSRLPNRIGGGGLHAFEGQRIYVSRGIGWEHGHAPRIRLLCPPEVSLITIRSR